MEIEKFQTPVKETNIFSPNKHDFETLSYEELHNQWRANNITLQTLLCDTRPPYFGLHGTSQKSFRGITANQRNFLEIATFYEKDYKSKKFLYQLYHAISYTYSYGIKQDQGRIIILNLEDEGDNITLPWEHLFVGAFPPALFDRDSDEENKNIESLQKTDHLLWRSEITLNTDRIVGSIDLSEGAIQPYNEIHSTDLAKYIMSIRILPQIILAQVLSKFKK